MFAARMDAPAAAAISGSMVLPATRAIGRIDLTAMAIGPTVMGIAGVIRTGRPISPNGGDFVNEVS